MFLIAALLLGLETPLRAFQHAGCHACMSVEYKLLLYFINYALLSGTSVSTAFGNPQTPQPALQVSSPSPAHPADLDIVNNLKYKPLASTISQQN